MYQETKVVIVGAGPAGLATSACLNLKNIPNVVLEKEDCCASLWKQRAYDRLKLHLAKEFCELPHMKFPPNSPTFVPRMDFIQYLDDYASHFNVNALYNREVQCASFDQGRMKWIITAKNVSSDMTETYMSEYLIVATGENSEGYIPPVVGLSSFTGEVMHSSHFHTGKRFDDKHVLVVGSGNSGMEIAYDLSNWGAKTFIVVRSPVHVLTKTMTRLGMVLLRYLPENFVDNIIVMLSKLKYGDISNLGVERPNEGPFYLKRVTGRSPVIDVGTINKIRAKEINVLPSINKVNGDTVYFTNGEKGSFDAIVFATGYKSTVRKWLKEEDCGLFNENGMPKNQKPNHWKGKNGIYCAGFASNGLFGISNDAKAIAGDIADSILSDNN